MKAIFKNKIIGYTALSRFLSDVPINHIEYVERKEIEGLPESRYSYSPDVAIERKGNMKFVRVETAHRTYSIYEII